MIIGVLIFVIVCIARAIYVVVRGRAVYGVSRGWAWVALGAFYALLRRRR